MISFGEPISPLQHQPQDTADSKHQLPQNYSLLGTLDKKPYARRHVRIGARTTFKGTEEKNQRPIEGSFNQRPSGVAPTLGLGDR